MSKEPIHDHGPLQEEARKVMKAIAEAADVFCGPRYRFAIFLIEVPEAAAKDKRLSRFNYAANVHRGDFVDVLKAFIAKYEAERPKLDKINDRPPVGRPQ